MGGSEGPTGGENRGIYLGLGWCEDEVVTCLKHFDFLD